jgi:ubiquinone/menaquinone biosynthesis C-methylase UbiE
MALFDGVADRYDASRGGEQRGDEYAVEIASRLRRGIGPVVEVGVGTGVVALGLKRRGFDVCGIDIAEQMLVRAQARLGTCVVCGDGRVMPFRDESIGHAVSVWMVHSLDRPEELFFELARVLRPGGRYFVCPTNHTTADDPIAPILREMFGRAQTVHPTWRHREVTIEAIIGWAEAAGFDARVEQFATRHWETSVEEQTQWILDRVWPGVTGLNDDDYEFVTAPALKALGSIEPGPIHQYAEQDLAVLVRP